MHKISPLFLCIRKKVVNLQCECVPFTMIGLHGEAVSSESLASFWRSAAFGS